MGAERVERVAFIGLGIMGRPMAANLARAGYDVTVWNRTRARAEELAAEDAVRIAGSPTEAAAAAEATITMVVDAPEVEAVVFGEEGVAAGAPQGSAVVDMSTIAPTASRAIGERLAGRGLPFLDAPVTGSRPKAEDGKLTIMVGGPEDAFARVRPLLEAMGELVLRVGPQGHGSMVKLLNNTVAAVNATALAEALVAGRRADLDMDKLLRVMAAGSGASAMLDLKAGPMLGGDFHPLFKLAHMLKDVRHCLAEAEALGVQIRVAGEAERLYAEAQSAGHGDEDFAAVIEAVKASG